MSNATASRITCLGTDMFTGARRFALEYQENDGRWYTRRVVDGKDFANLRGQAAKDGRDVPGRDDVSECVGPFGDTD